jgi:hypothetical protein
MDISMEKYLLEIQIFSQNQLKKKIMQIFFSVPKQCPQEFYYSLHCQDLFEVNNFNHSTIDTLLTIYFSAHK